MGAHGPVVVPWCRVGGSTGLFVLQWGTTSFLFGDFLYRHRSLRLLYRVHYVRGLSVSSVFLVGPSARFLSVYRVRGVVLRDGVHVDGSGDYGQTRTTTFWVSRGYVALLLRLNDSLQFVRLRVFVQGGNLRVARRASIDGYRFHLGGSLVLLIFPSKGVRHRSQDKLLRARDTHSNGLLGGLTFRVFRVGNGLV